MAVEIHLYKNDPTVGLTDGTLVSEETGASPITVTVLAGETSSSVKLAIRSGTGLVTTGDTTITPTGTTAAKWSLSLNNADWGADGAALTITAAIGAVNVIFYARAKSPTEELPVNDVTVDLNPTGVQEAV